jgi:hypothetical protein
MESLRKIIRQIISESLQSSSKKGQKILDALKSGEWESYESKGFMQKLDDEGKNKLISKLSQEDKETYEKWLKTSQIK